MALVPVTGRTARKEGEKCLCLPLVRKIGIHFFREDGRNAEITRGHEPTQVTAGTIDVGILVTRGVLATDDEPVWAIPAGMLAWLLPPLRRE